MMDLDALDELSDHEEDMRTVRRHDVVSDLAERDRLEQDRESWRAAWCRADWS